MPLPEAIKNAPEMEFGLELFFAAFSDLSTCRTTGMSEGPIPYSFIVDYAEMYDIVGEQRDDLLYHVRKLDNAYLEYQSKKTKS
jgi:hypothetical protein